MSVSILHTGFPSRKNKGTGFAFWSKTLTMLVLSLIGFSAAFSQSANLDQGENGSKTSRVSPVNWINGNLGPNNAHFVEGYSIPYRCRIDGLVGNSATVHTLVIEWDTKDQNGHALDYITHYQNLDNPSGSHQFNFKHAAETVDPTSGTAFNGAPSLYQIPTPSSTGAEVSGQPATSFGNLPGATGNANITKMAIWGGTITALTYLFQDNQDATTASTKTRLQISFTSTNGSTALLAWGGHIAAEYDWGTGRGASQVSGSPYHMRLINIDGKPGNQDRSLKATAVIIAPPCSLSAAQTACSGSSAGLTYSFTGSTTGITNYSWVLTPGTTNAVISGGNTTTTKSGAAVTSVTIVPATGTTFAVGTFTLQLTTTNSGGDGQPCTTTGTIVATPAQPTAVVKTPLCTDLTMTVEVTLPAGLSSSATVTLKQMTGGASPMTQNASAAVNGKLTFTGLTFGKGYSITITDGVSTALPAGCTSTPLECGNFSGGYQTTVANSQLAISDQEIVLRSTPRTTVLAAPNPFNDRIRFTLRSEVSGRGSLELYNTLGQRVKTVFQGQVTAGQAQTIEYAVPGSQRSSLIYVFRVGSDQTSGKLVGLKQ